MNKQSNLQNIRFRLFIILTLLSAVFGLLSTARAQVIRPQAVSAASGGFSLPNARTAKYDTSADGRFVVFETAATNLVPGLTEGNTGGTDIFLRDTKTNQTRCLSMNSARTATGNLRSFEPIITPDGAYVVFASDASDLVAHDTNGFVDVFRVHTGTGEIQMVSRNNTNQNGGNEVSVNFDGYLRSYDVSDDGRYIAFVSLASDLLPEPFLDNNGKTDIFVRDMTTGTTRCASFSTTFASTANDHSSDPAISADGQRVTFMSFATNLFDNQLDSAGSTNDIFIRNMTNMEIRCVSRGYGINRNRAVGGQGASMSKNGARIVFFSVSILLAPNDASGDLFDVFVYDYGLDTVFLVSADSSGASGGNANSGEAQSPGEFILNITPDGRYVVFESRATNLVANISDSPNTPDVFRRDLLNGETKMVSVSRNQVVPGNVRSLLGSRRAGISRDGRFIVFHSQATNLIAEPTQPTYLHPYVRDMNNGITFAGDFSLNGSGLGNNPSEKPMITPDGKQVFFASFASNLVPNDNNGTGDLFGARVPVPQTAVSDFDGDNRTDFAVFRPLIGTWYSLPANGFVNIRNWGQAGDKIVPADYDGDGKTDIAVYRPLEALWYIYESRTNQIKYVNFGLSTDTPTPGDYDGDGSSDIAVFRPSSGDWYVLRSSNGALSGSNWGMASDIPVPAAYLP